ncbi:MAG: acyltransferase [Muribaculaceae bacterium]|nr:acyltransferase [Muribaculaceae bacterium]
MKKAIVPSSETKNPLRDSYIDFLRGLGLLLLVVAHTWAPLTLTSIRTFDVPLMVIVSAMCYKPIQKDFISIKTYLWKRFLRIYVPVFIFVNLFFTAILCVEAYVGKNVFSVYQYIGSLFLLNAPSIGYVWIMRVFLMMALVLPFIEPLFKRLKPVGLVITLFSITILQECVILLFTYIPNGIVKFVLSETIPYIIGYSVFTAIGLRVNGFTYGQKIFLTALAGIGCLIYLLLTGNYLPQENKYPPHGLYLLWGWCGSCILILCKPLLNGIASWRCWSYLSKNSMWIYLWHIIPIYLITPLAVRPQVWLVRYLLVLGIALLLNYIYHLIISRFPKRIHKYIS